jgi:hypothetical protein
MALDERMSVTTATAARISDSGQSPATRGTDLRGEVRDLPVGMPYGGRDGPRSVEFQKAPRKVPSRPEMSHIEEGWVDDDATSCRGPNE